MSTTHICSHCHDTVEIEICDPRCPQCKMLVTRDLTDEARPYIVLAKLDSESVARWWVRSRGGRYFEWEPLFPAAGRRLVAPERLAPVRADYHRYVGDSQAIIEVHSARVAKESRRD